MKEWQHNIEMETLLEIEKEYHQYNNFALSPFARYNKNDIAKDIHEGKFYRDTYCSFVCTKVKKKTPITIYQDVKIAVKMPGDIVITKLRGHTDISVCNFLENFHVGKKENIWLYIWAEDFQMKNFLHDYGSAYEYVGSKITTFGEIYSIYYFSSNNETPIIPIDIAHYVTLKQITSEPTALTTILCHTIRNRLKERNLRFQNHYSNYNKGRSWSALSLRGYTSEIHRIEKPVEMSDKWKSAHAHEVYQLQNTSLYDEFPEVHILLNEFGDTNFHRIRFMRLAPGGGELTRHTDQVDPDSGGCVGNVGRFHLPISTNPDVKFFAWNTNGYELEEHMKEGEWWFLDTRKPHRVINNGKTDRIHLVVDVVITPELRIRLLTKHMITHLL